MSTANTTRASMSTTRKLALGAGLFYLATFVFSIPTLKMTDSFINNPNFVHGAGSGAGVQWAALFDMLTGLTGIGTAVMVYPVIKRYGRTNAIGFVASRTLEAAILAVSAISLLTMYTLRHDLGGTATAGLGVTAAALVAVHKWTFLFGPGVMASVNALCFATVLRRTGLVPRVIPTTRRHRRPAACHVVDRHDPRRLEPDVQHRHALHPPDRHLGARGRPVHDVQGLQGGDRRPHRQPRPRQPVPRPRLRLIR